MKKSYKDLEAWQQAFRLTKMVYELTPHMPQDERFGLIAQMQRAAVSIVSNIAEGAGRASAKEFAHFLNIAYASSCELETQLLLVKELYPQQADGIPDILSQLASVGRLLEALRRSMQLRNPETKQLRNLEPQ